MMWSEAPMMLPAAVMCAGRNDVERGSNDVACGSDVRRAANERINYVQQTSESN
jgi:hypothetical protein